MGYHVLIAHSTADVAVEDEAIKFLVDRQVDGLVLVPNNLRKDMAVFHRLALDQVPLLLLGSRLNGVSASFLGLDDVGGSILACRHLIKLGHKHIAFVGGSPGESSSDDRLAGYHQALHEANLSNNDELVVFGAVTFKEGMRAGDKILQMQPRPSAILTVNDDAAVGIAHTLQDRGVSIPEDIALAAASGRPADDEFFPLSLTKAVPSMVKWGERAAEIIINMIQNDPQELLSETLPHELVIGSSSGTLRSDLQEK